MEIRRAVMELGLFGDEKTGILRRFGVILSALPSTLYACREFNLIQQIGG